MTIAGPPLRRPLAARWLAVCLLPVACLAGCSRFDLEVGDKQIVQPAQFVAGRADYRDVLTQFGPPTKMTALPDGMAFLYEWFRLVEHQFGLTPDEVGLRSKILGLFRYLRISVAKAGGERRAAVFVFGHDGILRGTRYAKNDVDLGWTAGISGFVIPESLMSRGAYSQPATQHLWGMSLLEPIPKALNRAQDLDSGRAGLEQKSQPEDVGQRTLEK